MNYKILLIVVSLAFLALFAFIMFKPNNSNITPQNITKPIEQNASKKIIIAAFGDSLTAGYGVNLEESYPSILEKYFLDKKINARVINMGVSGETTVQGANRVEFVLSQKPDIILLGLGANDMLRSLPPSQTRASLETIIQAIQKENVKIILLGMKSSQSNGEDYIGEFNIIYPDLAQKYNLPLVPFFLQGVVLNQNFNTSDGIHPNTIGYEKIVTENILPILLPVLERFK